MCNASPTVASGHAAPIANTKPALMKTTTGAALEAYHKELAEAQKQVAVFLVQNHFKEIDPNCKRGMFFVTYPLHEAVKQGNAYIAYWLLKFGANCCALDGPFRHHAYHYAKKHGGEEMLQVLERYIKSSHPHPVRPPLSLRKVQYIPPPRGFEEFFAKVGADHMAVENEEDFWLQVCGRTSLRKVPVV